MDKNTIWWIFIVIIPAFFGAFLSMIGLPLIDTDTWYIAFTFISLNSIICVYTYNKLRSYYESKEEDKA